MLSCHCGNYYDWYFVVDEGFNNHKLSTRTRKRCCNCKKLIKISSICSKIERFKINEAGDKKLSDWYLCERCSDLAESIEEQGYCYTLGEDSLEKQIKE
jgi:hypothetical protein